MNTYCISVPYLNSQGNDYIHEIKCQTHVKMFDKLGINIYDIRDGGCSWSQEDKVFYHRWTLACTDEQMTYILLTTGAIITRSHIEK